MSGRQRSHYCNSSPAQTGRIIVNDCFAIDHRARSLPDDHQQYRAPGVISPQHIHAAYTPRQLTTIPRFGPPKDEGRRRGRNRRRQLQVGTGSGQDVFTAAFSLEGTQARNKGGGRRVPSNASIITRRDVVTSTAIFCGDLDVGVRRQRSRHNAYQPSCAAFCQHPAKITRENPLSGNCKTPSWPGFYYIGISFCRPRWSNISFFFFCPVSFLALAAMELDLGFRGGRRCSLC